MKKYSWHRHPVRRPGTVKEGSREMKKAFRRELKEREIEEWRENWTAFGKKTDSY